MYIGEDFHFRFQNCNDLAEALPDCRLTADASHQCVSCCDRDYCNGNIKAERRCVDCVDAVDPSQCRNSTIQCPRGEVSTHPPEILSYIRYRVICVLDSHFWTVLVFYPHRWPSDYGVHAEDGSNAIKNWSDQTLKLAPKLVDPMSV